MAILVTGGAGFVGLNIVDALLRSGRDVVVLDAEPIPPSALTEFATRSGKLAFVLGDVRDAAVLDKVFASHPIDQLIHGAALTASTERERTDPIKIAEINLLGTIRVLSAAHHAKIERIVMLSTGSVYGDAGRLDDGRLDEAVQRPVPNNIYGITKYAAERTSLRLAELWGLDLRVGRPGIVFGCWERETGYRDGMSLVLQVTRSAETGTTAVIQTKGPEDWIYAPDLATSVLALLDAASPPRPVYNLGTGNPWPLSAWCDRLKAKFPYFNYRTTDNLAETTVSVLSASSVRSPFAARAVRDELGFVPRYDVNAAFEHYLSWRLAHPAIG